MLISTPTTERQPLLVTPHTQIQHEEVYSKLQTTRAQTRRFFTSKTGHYAILLLVSLDVSSIFADFIISLYVCEHTCRGKPYSKEPEHSLENISAAQDVLGVISLVFSCLFLAELLASIWAFGFSFFKSKFHCFDAAIIVAGFVVDVCLKGVLEEIGSIVVVLRLWRVVKIIEELSAGAEEQMEAVVEKLEQVERQRDDVARQLQGLRKRGGTGEGLYDQS